MTDRAALAHGGMLVHNRPGLLAMAVGTRFVQAVHGQSTCGFHDVHAVRIVALDAIHIAFGHGMMLRKSKFRLYFHMASITGLWIFAGIDDEFFLSAAADHRNVLAAGPMTGFAAVLAGHGAVVTAQTRMRAAGKYAADFIVAIGAGLVTDISRPFDL